jgi:hypothetical protein
MAVVTRLLSVSESIFVWAGIGPIVASVTLDGPVDPVFLAQACRLLVRDYPLLRCRIRETDDGLALVALEDDGPNLVEGLPGFAAELSAPLADGAVSRMSFLPAQDGTIVRLTVSHAVSDARLVVLLLHTLLRYYTTLLSGDTPPPTGRPVFDGPLEERLLGRYEPGRPESSGTAGPPIQLSGPGVPDGHAPAQRDFVARHLVIGPAETAALVAVAKNNGSTVTDVLYGTICCAIREQYPGSDRALPVAVGVPVDLRGRLDPPVAPDEQFCCVGRCVVNVDVEVGARPIAVGQRVGVRVREAIEQSAPQRLLLAECLDPAAPQPMTSVVVSNIGTLDDPVLPTGLKIIESRFASATRGPVPRLYVSTLYGMLIIDLICDPGHHQLPGIENVLVRLESLLVSPLTT